MRLIGEIPSNLDPRILEDHLLGQGMKSRIDRRPDGWAVWIINEDHVAAASKELQDFVADPDDPRFRANASKAREVRKETAKKEREFRKNNRDSGDIWGAPTFRRRPVTVVVVIIAAVVFTLQHSSYGRQTTAWLGYYDWRGSPAILRPHKGLADIMGGQVWRAVTPIFLHFGPWHILFNGLWMMALGTAIEVRRGSWKLLTLIVVSAILSNFAEYAYIENWQEGMLGLRASPPWGGLSGVVYALFGYIWMMGENHPEEGLNIDSRNVVIMLAWLVICFTGFLGPIANAAHLGGLAVGMVMGLMRF
ncbi:rhomboid family intramembrane serine protease [Paludisphaera rhizosphaerae]|uniref:rhomboid family intramembrane serine protease n=1 Tax=Paludisphaera rhizosphaerae TaxID=2711216 RepID=UPI0013EA6C76|nr:rhomboid family intramembrane serine protease [Paludisphaera rhizosphaerae]